MISKQNAKKDKKEQQRYTFQAQTSKVNERERQRETERGRERQRETERGKERQRDRERDRVKDNRNSIMENRAPYQAIKYLFVRSDFGP